MLESILSKHEGKTLEFKENTDSLERILKTIIAFSNTAGSIILIGIKDKTKEVVGIRDVLKEKERIANAVADSIAPQLTPNFQFHTWRGLDLLIINVSHSFEPHYFKEKGIEQGTYIRFGSTNRLADKGTIAEMQRLALHQSFDETANLQAKIEDLNFDLAHQLFSQVSKKFSENFATNAFIQCGLFSGKTKSKILDQKEINAPLPIVIDEVLIFLQRHTSTKSIIEGKKRIDIPQYPLNVLREAVTNTIVHADYSIKGANIQVAIFEDRIEIINPGALPFGLSLEKAISGISQLRNKVIGHVFRELGLIEKWGSGLSRMISTCEELGIKKPKFEEVDHFFRVTLYHEHEILQVKEKWIQKVIEYLRNKNKITTKEACVLWEVTNRTASTKLKKLCELGILIEVSTNRNDPKKHFILRS